MIDTKALKTRLIDLAIRGKLTKQHSEDGNAELLYFQIQNEKANLIKEGKIRNNRPLPEIVDGEIPFAIPQNWKWIRAGDIIRVISGTSYAKGDVSYKGIRILRGGNILNSKVTYSNDDVFVPYEYFDKEKTLQENDVLIVASTGSSTGIGKPGIVCISDESAQSGAFLRVIRTYCEEVSRYVDLFFLSSEYTFRIRALAKGMNINNIKEKHITEMLIPLPPLAEQERIVRLIDEFFEQIDIIDDLQKQYESDCEILKGKIIDAGIRGKLTERFPEDGDAEKLYQLIQEEKNRKTYEGKIKKTKLLPEISETEIPFNLPDKWIWCRLESVYNFIDYRGATPNKISEGVPFVTAKNVRQGYIDYSVKEFISEKDYSNRQSRGISCKGDLLFTTEAPMGYAAIADLEKFSAGQRLITLQQYTDSQSLDNKYYMYCIAASFFQKQLDEKCSGTTVKGIKADRLKLFLIPLPPFEEQKRIVERIETALKLI